MLGWWIVVMTEAQRAAADEALAAGKKGPFACLASWESSVGGLDWLDGLVAANKAQTTPSAGYPKKYQALARDVVPLIAAGPPRHRSPGIIGDDYVMPANWSGKAKLDLASIEACEPDQKLLIEAWDMS